MNTQEAKTFTEWQAWGTHPLGQIPVIATRYPSPIHRTVGTPSASAAPTAVPSALPFGGCHLLLTEGHEQVTMCLVGSSKSQQMRNKEFSRNRIVIWIMWNQDQHNQTVWHSCKNEISQCLEKMKKHEKTRKKHIRVDECGWRGRASISAPAAPSK